MDTISDPRPTQSKVADKAPEGKTETMHCIMKEYVRLITKRSKTKKQRPNLPFKTREKLYEKARKRILKNHKMYIIPKENTAKLHYKWPSNPTLDGKEQDAHIMDEDIEPCPSECSKCPKPTPKGEGYIAKCTCPPCEMTNKKRRARGLEIRTISQTISQPEDTPTAETETPKCNEKEDDSIKAVKKEVKVKTQRNTKKNTSKKTIKPIHPILSSE